MCMLPAMNHRSFALRAFSVVGFGALLLACSIDNKKVEQSVIDTMKDKGVKMKSVSCPTGKPMKSGTKFDCTGTSDDGVDMTFHVEETDGSGTIKWELDGLILDKKKLGDGLEKDLGGGADIKCPEKTVIIHKGTTFDCDYEKDGEKGTVTLTADDDKGNFTVKKKGGAGGDDSKKKKGDDDDDGK